jgi:hypothetical protein
MKKRTLTTLIGFSKMAIRILFLTGFSFLCITSSAWARQEEPKTCDCYGCDGTHVGVCKVLYAQNDCDSQESCSSCCGGNVVVLL